MRKATSMTAIVTVFLTSMLALALSAGANMGGFSVSPIFSENQNPATQGFFDLRVGAGGQQEISISISNLGEEPIDVEVMLVTAATNRNGIISYSGSGQIDRDIPHQFAEMASFPGDGNINIPAGQSAILPITIDLPSDGFDGVILGSVRVLLGISDEERAQAGMIVNRFAQTIPIRLTHREGIPDPDFLMGGVAAELVAHRAAIVAEIRHPIPRQTMGAAVSAQIYPAGSSDAIFTVSEMSVDFAPNTVFPFSLIDDAGFGIQAGNYTATILIEHDGRTWTFEEPFTIALQEAAAVNTAAANQQQQQQPAGGLAIPIWVIAAIGAGVVIMVVLIFLVVKSKRAGAKDLEVFNQRMQSIGKNPPPQQSAEEKDPDKQEMLDQIKNLDKEELARLMEEVQAKGKDN